MIHGDQIYDKIHEISNFKRKILQVSKFYEFWHKFDLCGSRCQKPFVCIYAGSREIWSRLTVLWNFLELRSKSNIQWLLQIRTTETFGAALFWVTTVRATIVHQQIRPLSKNIESFRPKMAQGGLFVVQCRSITNHRLLSPTSDFVSPNIGPQLDTHSLWIIAFLIFLLKWANSDVYRQICQVPFVPVYYPLSFDDHTTSPLYNLDVDFGGNSCRKAETRFSNKVKSEIGSPKSFL